MYIECIAHTHRYSRLYIYIYIFVHVYVYTIYVCVCVFQNGAALNTQDVYCFFFIPVSAKKRFPFYAVLPMLRLPFPISSMLTRWWCNYARAERESFFAGRRPPLVTLPTLKRWGKGRRRMGSTNKKGNLFSQTPVHTKMGVECAERMCPASQCNCASAINTCKILLTAARIREPSVG